MAGINSIGFAAETQKTLAFGSITASYVAVGTLANPACIYWIQNLTNATLQFSIDGTNDHFPLLANAFVLLDIGTNGTHQSSLSVPAGTTLYVKEIGNPSSGSVYLSSFYRI